MSILRIALYALTAAGLIVNAIIHLRLASAFDALTGTLLSQGDLFRIQAVAGILIVVLLIAVRRWWVAAIAALIAVGGLGMLVLSSFVILDLTALGLPAIFEPSWYPDKIIAAVSQAVAATAAGALAVLEHRRRASARRVS